MHDWDHLDAHDVTPWLADWWELIRWGRAKKIVATWGQD